MTKIETDYTPPAPGQLTTRIEAFLETLPNTSLQKRKGEAANMNQNAIFARHRQRLHLNKRRAA